MNACQAADSDIPHVSSDNARPKRATAGKNCWPDISVQSPREQLQAPAASVCDPVVRQKKGVAKRRCPEGPPAQCCSATNDCAEPRISHRGLDLFHPDRHQVANSWLPRGFLSVTVRDRPNLLTLCLERGSKRLQDDRPQRIVR